MDQNLQAAGRRRRAFPLATVAGRMPSGKGLKPTLRKQEEGSLQVGLLVALGLVVSATGAVWLLQSGDQVLFSGGEASNAQAIAEAGADIIIGVWNEPENRRHLVAGDAAPNTWTNANQTSPCLSSTNTRPGAYNGNPTPEARGLVDGNFRNIDDITQTATGDRRFRLKAVRYSTGAAGSSNRRTISRTYNTTSSTPTTSIGTLAGNFRDLINLDDPDGSGTLRAGINTGFIAVEVESQVYRNGALVGTATVTKEYQVLPKCCGASPGSNNSGGSTFNTVNSGAGSLGSDSRYCGVDFGMIVGLNGGKFWTYAANDFYKTIDPSTGEQVNVKSILGLVSDPSYRFERNAASADNNNGCRVIPGPCSGNEQYVAGSSTTDASLYSSINSSSITGTASDRAGRSASGVPIVPLFINGGLPSVNSRFGYTWTAGGRPAVNFASGGTFGPTFTSTGTSTTFRLRTRNDTNPPRVEFCDATYLTNNLCTSSSWVPVSLPAGTTANPTVTISEDFASNSFGGTSNDRWPTAWEERDTASGGTGVSAGNVLVQSGVARLRYVSGAPSWSTATNRAAISRVVNLHALQSPHLSFTQTVEGLSGTNATLEVRFSTNNAAINTDTGWTSLMTTNASGGTTGTGASCSGSGTTRTCRVPLPLAAQTGYTKIRFRANSNFSTSQSVTIDNVAITNNAGGAVSLDNWCEYSTTRPNTAQFIGGFHCLGPLLVMANGGDFIVDTSGGNINFYYNSGSDTRGASLSTPLINMAAGAELLHVNCPNSGALTEPPSPTGAAVTPSNNCLTGIPTTVYAAVGENDLLNIFGRDTPPNNSTSNPTMQWVRIGSTSASPGKISGAFFYMPYGSIYLVQDQCTTGGSNPNATFNFSGRIWSRFLIACGVSYFLTPPSSTLNLQALGINSNISLNASGFAGSTGIDWTASIATSTRVNSSL